MASIPASHVDLLTRPLPAVLVSVMPDGRPQALELRALLDAAYIGPDHFTDPAHDKAPQLVVTLEPIAVHAYG